MVSLEHLTFRGGGDLYEGVTSVKDVCFRKMQPGLRFWNYVYSSAETCKGLGKTNLICNPVHADGNKQSP